MSDKYWYNLVTHEVEKGYQSPAADRAGPFETAADAARAPEIIRERSRAWADDDARDARGSQPADDSRADS